jgi:uncharacterized protein (TIGR02246 family)
MNWKSLIFTATLLLLPASAAFADDAADIRKTLEDQVADWNRGDIQKFVSVYTEDSVFVGTEIQRGQKQVLERYLKRYPNKEAMGKTTFSNLEIKLLGNGHASVIGNWRVERSQQAGGNIGGIFTLLLRKSGKQWKIILDHTS